MFFKKKKIKLEAYAPAGELIDLFPPVVAKEAIPEWYNQLPANKGLFRQKNVKHCSGFKELYNEGVILPAWSDYNIIINPDGQVQSESPYAVDSGHSSSHEIQREAFGAWPGYTNIKLHSPWWFWCSEPVKWLIIQPTWNRHDPTAWAMPPGITEFKYQHQTNVQMLFKVEQQPYTYQVKPGEALLHIIPLFDRPWELELKVMSNDTWASKFARWKHSFDLEYQKTRSIIGKKK